METWNEIHTVEQCLKVKVLAEGQVFSKHMTGHILKVFDTSMKIRVMQASTNPWSCLILDWITVISPSLAT